MKKYAKEIIINFSLINFIPFIVTVITILYNKGIYIKDILFVYKVYLGGLLGNILLPIPFNIEEELLFIFVLFIFNLMIVSVYTVFMINSKIDKIYIYTTILGILSSLFGFFFFNVTA